MDWLERVESICVKLINDAPNESDELTMKVKMRYAESLFFKVTHSPSQFSIEGYRSIIQTVEKCLIDQLHWLSKLTNDDAALTTAVENPIYLKYDFLLLNILNECFRRYQSFPLFHSVITSDTFRSIMNTLQGFLVENQKLVSRTPQL